MNLFERYVLLFTAAVAVLAAGCPSPTPIAAVAASGSVESAPEITIAENAWPWWGGKAGDQVTAAKLPATEWTSTENVLWSAEVGGRGHSTPVVVDEMVVLTTADESQQEQQVVAFAQADGAELWRTTVHAGDLPKMHRKNSHASATPAFDGRHLFAVFIHGESLFVSALDAKGEIVWQTDAGAFNSEHGYGASPVLHESLVIVNGDNLEGCFLAAIHRETGDLVWRVPRPTTGRHGSYATPAVADVNGKSQIVLTGMKETIGYDPDTGELLWQVAGPAEVTAGAIASGGGLVFASGGYPEKSLLAIRPPSSADESAEVVWEASRGVTYVPSPVYHDNRLYVVNDQGVASCFDASSGKRIWQERLRGSFSASPLLTGDLLVVTNESGTTFVLRAADEYELVAENELQSGGFASPVVSGGKLYLRTDDQLVCIGEPTES